MFPRNIVDEPLKYALSGNSDCCGCLRLTKCLSSDAERVYADVDLTSLQGPEKQVAMLYGVYVLWTGRFKGRVCCSPGFLCCQ